MPIINFIRTTGSHKSSLQYGETKIIKHGIHKCLQMCSFYAQVLTFKTRHSITLEFFMERATQIYEELKAAFISLV